MGGGSDRDAFVDAMRRRFEAESPSDRFKPIKSSLEYTDQRGYPCVRYRSEAQDTRAQVSATKTASLRLEVLSLVCRLPAPGGMAFSASYSSRSETTDPDFEIAAMFFIEGRPTPGQVVLITSVLRTPPAVGPDTMTVNRVVTSLAGTQRGTNGPRQAWQIKWPGQEANG